MSFSKHLTRLRELTAFLITANSVVCFYVLFANKVQFCSGGHVSGLRRWSLIKHQTPCPLSVIDLGSCYTIHSSLSLALDGIQDPGNLGTIIRIADWFGIQTIFCSEDTVDAWNPKVVQATMGSIARVNIYYMSLSALIDTLPADYPVYGTLLDGDNIYTQPLTPHGLIVMGNEGNGISPEIRAKVNRRLLIPSYSQDDTAESLNVAIATAITCAEFRRRNT